MSAASTRYSDDAPAARSGLTVARDGTPIAWSSVGDPDAPALVLTNGYATSSFYWDHVVAHFASRAQVVTWDLKGHGGSGAARSRAVTVPDSVDDLTRVMDAVGVERAVLGGFSMGCQIVLESWRHVPERISAMVPILGTYGRPFDSLLHPTFGRVAQVVLRSLGPVLAGPGLRFVSRSASSDAGHRMNQRTGMVGHNVPRERMRPFAEHLAQIDPATWVAMGVAAQSHSAEDLLPQIDVPVLVVSGGRDVMTPQSCSQRMVDALRRVEHLHLPDATHTGLYEYPVEINRSLEHFLERHGVLAGSGEAGDAA